MRAEACMSIVNIDISDIGLAIMARMSEVNDEKIRAPKHVRPWSVRYSSGRADEWSVSTSDWVKVKFDNEVVRWWWYRIRRKACKSGWCACDSLWKVPAVRHLREGHGEHWNFLQPSPRDLPQDAPVLREQGLERTKQHPPAHSISKMWESCLTCISTPIILPPTLSE